MLNKIASFKDVIKKIKYGQKGEATLATIIGLFLTAALMFIVPLMIVTTRGDDVAQSTVDAAVSDTVEAVTQKREFTEKEWNDLNSKLANTGNKYDITVEVKHFDENLGKKTAIGTGDLIGENERYSTFISEKEIESGYKLQKGDIVIITVKNTNKTLAQSIRSFMFKVTGQNSYEIMSTASGIVN